MPLVYALVARASDGVPLAQYAVIPGNFEARALECLAHSRRQGVADDRFVVPCDGYAFNFLIHGPYAAVVVADSTAGPKLALACCRRICAEWAASFWDSGQRANAHTLDRAFG